MWHILDVATQRLSKMAYTQKNLMDSVLKYSAQYNVPATYAGAVVMVESTWNPYPAVSSAGCVGPMQVTPITNPNSVVKDLVKNGYLPAEAASDPKWLLDPDNNVRAGVATLSFYSGNGDLTNQTVQDTTAQKYFGGPSGYDTSECRDYAAKVKNNKPSVEESISAYTDDSNVSGVFKPPSGAVLSTSPSGIAGAGANNSNAAANRSATSAEPEWDFSIAKFAKFIATTTFYQYMQRAYEQSMEMSLHGFVERFMQRFYHTVCYIPTLPNCMAVVVKPDTYFVSAPSCNLLFPTLKTSIDFTRNYKQEPTRMLVSSDPIQGILKREVRNVGNIGIINTLAFMDYKDGKEVITGFDALKSLLGETKEKPLVNCSDYEAKNGIRIQRLAGGDDFYLFMLGTPGTNAEGAKKQDKLLKLSEEKVKAASATLTNLAKYHLLRARFDTRPGSVSMVFNPYIVPGFPMISIEGVHESNLNVVAYVTHVEHRLTSHGASTTVSFNGTHIDSDPQVMCMPIIEAEYEKGIGDTYKNLFGAAVKPVPQGTGVKEAITKFKETKGSVAETLKQVWRPITTMEEYMKTLAHGAKLNTTKKYGVMESKFFKPDTQKLLMGYCDKLMSETPAFYETDVR